MCLPIPPSWFCHIKILFKGENVNQLKAFPLLLINVLQNVLMYLLYATKN